MTAKGKSGQSETALAKCGRCRHYYVTWDMTFPHGCRAMGFKSRTSPAAEVRTASGMECQMYAPRRNDE